MSADFYVGLLIFVLFRFILSHNMHSFYLSACRPSNMVFWFNFLSACRPFLTFINLHKSLLLNCHLLIVLVGTCSNYFKPIYNFVFSKVFGLKSIPPGEFSCAILQWGLLGLFQSRTFSLASSQWVYWLLYTGFSWLNSIKNLLTASFLCLF